MPYLYNAASFKLELAVKLEFMMTSLIRRHSFLWRPNNSTDQNKLVLHTLQSTHIADFIQEKGSWLSFEHLGLRFLKHVH